MRMASIVLVLLLFLPVIEAGPLPIPPEGPIILVYSGSMPGWGTALSEIIEGDPRAEYRCVTVEDRELLSLLLFLPRTEGLVLSPVGAADVTGLGPIVEDFMGQGGAVVGFSPCVDVRREPEMSSRVFPFFANQTAGPQRLGGAPVNTYVSRDADPRIDEGLPGTFQLISEGFLLARGPGGGAVEIPPDEGERRVFYEENRTGAPLVIGYQRPGSGRSVGFSGCRVNGVPRSPSFYGRLAAQEGFVRLLRNAVLWAVDGSPRYSNLRQGWNESLRSEATRRTDAALKAAEAGRKMRRHTMLVLISLWVVAGVACIVVTWVLVLGQRH